MNIRTTRGDGHLNKLFLIFFFFLPAYLFVCVCNEVVCGVHSAQLIGPFVHFAKNERYNPGHAHAQQGNKHDRTS